MLFGHYSLLLFPLLYDLLPVAMEIPSVSVTTETTGDPQSSRYDGLSRVYSASVIQGGGRTVINIYL